MIKFKKSDYYNKNGHKFFFVRSVFQFQCAYCLFVQYAPFTRNTEGLIIGVTLGKEEHHALDCKQHE